ncbi:MAG: NAD+ synthase [Rhodocyclaceae bacterium]|nr:NAD+ synthase [Rhodocyclaceae bacterium]
MLRLSIAQLNLTIGDMEHNVQRMVEAARQAHAQGAHAVAFPELSLCGYYPGDLLNEAHFLQRVRQGLDALYAASSALPDLYWIIGAPLAAHGPGKPLHNALLVLHGGKVLRHYAKQLLPTYDVFDERRHFEPGPQAACLLSIAGCTLGFLICEDGWNDAGREYANNPFECLRAAAPDLVITINASPSNAGKRAQRHSLFAAASRRHGLPLVYVNQVGGHDQLVYDGASFAVEPDAGVVFEAPRFEEALATLDFADGRFRAPGGGALTAPARADLPAPAFYRAQIVLGLKDYARRCGFTRAVVGCSGGIDSAVTLALACEALGPQNIAALTMPSRISSSGSVSDSAELCRNLGIALTTHPIAELVDCYARQFQASFDRPLQGLALENLQARVRGTVLMEYSNSFGHLLLTTGNKSEISVGYCTLYGDTNGGLGLIGDLYKTEVYALAEHLNASAGLAIIPHAIIAKPPSAELAPGQRDTDSLPPYPLLDEVLKVLIEGERLAAEEAAQAGACFAALQGTGEGQALIARLRNMIARNEYKRRQAAPILRVRARAFGSGRQMPIAAHYV